MRLARQLIRVQRRDESMSDFVHDMRPTYDDMNESCLLVDGTVVLHKHFLSIFMLVSLFQEGKFRLATRCIVNAFDPNLAQSAADILVENITSSRTTSHGYH
jgi:hypothetical protein